MNLRPSMSITAVLLILAGCGSDTAAPPGEIIVEMRDNSFSPQERTIDRGATIRWRNVGQFPHNTTSGTGAWSSTDLPPNGAFTHRFDNAGTFDYSCTLHAGMTGRIIVQ